MPVPMAVKKAHYWTGSALALPGLVVDGQRFVKPSFPLLRVLNYSPVVLIVWRYHPTDDSGFDADDRRDDRDDYRQLPADSDYDCL